MTIPSVKKIRKRHDELMGNEKKSRENACLFNVNNGY